MGRWHKDKQNEILHQGLRHHGILLPNIRPSNGLHDAITKPERDPKKSS